MEADEPSLQATSPYNEKAQQSNGEFNYSDELVFYNEEISRVEEEQLKKPIHQSMVALTFLDADNMVNTGSGVLISRSIVLTAAHNIFNKELNAENSDFKVYIGANGVVEEYYQAEAWKYPEDFKICKPSAKLPHDFAIMKLKKPVDFKQYISLSLVCKECLLTDNKIQLKVFGFPRAYLPDALSKTRPFEDNFKPLDKVGKRMKLYQYGLARRGRITVVEAQQSKIGYDISTLPGQSGCPVVADNSIIAVHVGGYNAQFNIGRIVDASFVDILWKWSEELNAASFKLKDQKVCRHVKQTLDMMQFKLVLQNKGLKSLDLHEYGKLLELDLSENKLGQIDLAHCLCLTTINLNRNQLQRIDLTNHKNLSYLDLSNNKLQKIDVKANINLTQLYLHNNKLQEINVRANVDLAVLSLAYNKLQEIDVRANANLTQLVLGGNKLQQIDLRTNVNLTQLSLFTNNLLKLGRLGCTDSLRFGFAFRAASPSLICQSFLPDSCTRLFRLSNAESQKLIQPITQNWSC